jgi:DAACS family dicarboxylate/amino acid:cation (Na+ or H+) symporter
MTEHSKERGVSLHTKILIALILGAILGVIVNGATGGQLPEWLKSVVEYGLRPVGQIFLRMLFMTVVPLVFASLAVGVAQLGGGKDLGRIGLKTFAFFLITMAMAVSLGLILVNVVRPGQGISEETRQSLLDQFQSKAEAGAQPSRDFGIDTFISIVPRNPLKALVEMDMLAVICFALFVGIAMTKINPEHALHLQQILEGINDIMVIIIGWAMKLAPFGVFALIFATTAELGVDLLKTLIWYVVVVLVGLSIQMFIVMPILLIVLARYNPLKFFRKAQPVMVTAFSTSSSSATLPTSIKTAQEELGVPGSIAGFVLPLGATMNMNGTALFEGVTVMFLAQVFGQDLSFGSQLMVVILSVLTSVGAAGVPGGSLPLLAMVLSYVHVPPEGIAVILGVDRILDMCRTTLNSTCDVVAALFVARTEGVLEEIPQATDFSVDSAAN